MPYPIVVLNGANGAAVEMVPLAMALSPYGQVYNPNIIGHGGRPIPERLTVEAIAADLIAFLDSKKIERAIFVGYSLGGLLSLYLARHHPERVAAIIGVAVKFIIDPATVERWVNLGDPERIARPGNPRAAELARMHHPQDWRKVTLTNNEWYRDLGARPPLSVADLQAIKTPIFLYSGKADLVVSEKEQIQLSRLLNCPLAMYPGSMHPLRYAPLGMTADMGRWIKKLQAKSGSQQPA